MKLVYGIDKVVRRVGIVLAVLGMVALVGILLLTSAEILMRTAFNSPVRGSLEMIAYLMVVCTFLPLAYVRRMGDLISVRVVIDRLPARYGKVHDRIVVFIDMAIALMLLAASVAAMLEYHERGVMTAGSLKFPIWYVTLVVVVGLVLFVIELVLELIRGSRAEVETVEAGLDVVEGI